MVRRVCRGLGNKRNIVVINDEAHHCYRRSADGETPRVLIGEDRKEAEKRNEEARVWITGLEAVKRRSASGRSTTCRRRRSSCGLRLPRRTLFPVGGLGLLPDRRHRVGHREGPARSRRRRPDDGRTARRTATSGPRSAPTCPRRDAKTEAIAGEPQLPVELGRRAPEPLRQLRRVAIALWERTPRQAARQTPPVFIVVCNNTNVSKLVFDYIAGWEKDLAGRPNGRRAGPAALFSNVEDGDWPARPNTILVDSAQLESGEAMSAEFKRSPRAEIEEFKAEYRAGSPAATPTSDRRRPAPRSDEHRRQARQARRAGPVRGTVSMLTEGWDANTVTHILGVRAFGTQLLCEQVVGRGLRRHRATQANDETAVFEPEYAEVYGVPFSFIPTAGTTPTPQPGPSRHARARAGGSRRPARSRSRACSATGTSCHRRLDRYFQRAAGWS